MKTHLKNLFVLPVLITAIGLILAGRVAGQTFTTLHSFTAGSGSVPYITNSDGAYPYAGLILSSNTLYGTALYGGSSGYGTVFAVNTNGTGFAVLHSFTAIDPTTASNSDGAYPYGGLVLSGNTLYGTAELGGSSGKGTVFAVNTDGTGFVNLYSFTALSPYDPPNPRTNSDGANPRAGLILSGNTLYGTAVYGGNSGNGTVFAVNTDGRGFTNLHSFTGGSDGANPYAGLLLSGDTVYGTAYDGGSSGNGTVFAVNTNGTGFTNLHSFTGGSDGLWPYAGLLLSSNTLYGTAFAGSFAGAGTVFAVNTDGTGFTNLHSFTSEGDGGNPNAGLILSGKTLYGATPSDMFVSGTVFKVNTDGTDFTTLYGFTTFSGGSRTNSDGAGPTAGLILSGNTLYGTASGGGSSGNGTVFSLFIPPKLTSISSPPNVILSWPTNYAGYTLQSTRDLAFPFWTTNYPAPVVVNGQYTVTNPISGNQQFFRLIQ